MTFKDCLLLIRKDLNMFPHNSLWGDKIFFYQCVIQVYCLAEIGAIF